MDNSARYYTPSRRYNDFREHTFWARLEGKNMYRNSLNRFRNVHISKDEFVSEQDDRPIERRYADPHLRGLARINWDLFYSSRRSEER